MAILPIPYLEKYTYIFKWHLKLYTINVYNDQNDTMSQLELDENTICKFLNKFMLNIDTYEYI